MWGLEFALGSLEVLAVFKKAAVLHSLFASPACPFPCAVFVPSSCL